MTRVEAVAKHLCLKWCMDAGMSENHALLYWKQYREPFRTHAHNALDWLIQEAERASAEEWAKESGSPEYLRAHQAARYLRSLGEEG